MLKILGFNGSPRSGWNTSLLVKKALEGAASQGASTEYFDLGSIKFDGCQSCLICKKGPKFEGKCYHKDGLSPILEKMKQSDGFILGAPIYMGLPSALSHAFLERAIFSSCAYRTTNGAVFGKKIKTGLIVTTGAPPKQVNEMYQPLFKQLTGFMSMCYGSCEFLGSYDTLQVNDYSKYDIQICDPKEKHRLRKEQFPIDLTNAFELGRKLATK
jgi:multimeric flavodoxin WrbA